MRHFRNAIFSVFETRNKNIYFWRFYRIECLQNSKKAILPVSYNMDSYSEIKRKLWENPIVRSTLRLHSCVV